jgi:Concanavalin A-like lectin/glucanases superfamily
MKRINSLVQKLSRAALHVTVLAVVGFLGAPGNLLGATVSAGSACLGGQTIFESSGYTAAGCLFTSGPTTPNLQSCYNQNLTIFLPSNSGTSMICVQPKYAALVANDTLNQSANPKGYLYLPTWFDEPALTLDSYGISYIDGVHTPFRGLKCAQPPSGMTAWWTLDQWAMGPMVNQVPTTGNLNGNPVGTTIVTGESGAAAYFNGSAYIDVPNNPNIDTKFGNFSIDAWVKIDKAADSSAAVRVIVEKRTVAVSPGAPGVLPGTKQYTGYSFYLYNGYLGLQWAETSAFQNIGAPSLVVPPDGLWHFVAVSVSLNPVAGLPAIQFTLDGASVQPLTFADGGILSNTSDLRIGMDTIGNGNDGFIGSIDEVQFFNRALTPNDFQSIRNAQSYGTCK